MNRLSLKMFFAFLFIVLLTPIMDIINLTGTLGIDLKGIQIRVDNLIDRVVVYMQKGNEEVISCYRENK